MPTFTRRDISLYYEEFGSGYPLLLWREPAIVVETVRRVRAFLKAYTPH